MLASLDGAGSDDEVKQRLADLLKKLKITAPVEFEDQAQTDEVPPSRNLANDDTTTLSS